MERSMRSNTPRRVAVKRSEVRILKGSSWPTTWPTFHQVAVKRSEVRILKVLLKPGHSTSGIGCSQTIRGQDTERQRGAMVGSVPRLGCSQTIRGQDTERCYTVCTCAGTSISCSQTIRGQDTERRQRQRRRGRRQIVAVKRSEVRILKDLSRRGIQNESQLLQSNDPRSGY